MFDSKDILPRLCDQWQTDEQKEHRSVELPWPRVCRPFVTTPPALLLCPQEVWRVWPPFERSSSQCNSGPHTGKRGRFTFSATPLMLLNTVHLTNLILFDLQSTGLQQSRPRPNGKNPRVLHVINQSHRSQCSVGSSPCFTPFNNTGHSLLGGGVTHGVRLWVWISDVTSARSQVAVKGRYHWT